MDKLKIISMIICLSGIVYNCETANINNLVFYGFLAILLGVIG